MKIWELLGGLTVIVILIFWIRWLRTPNPSATWPENNWARASLFYAIPISLTSLGTTGVATFAEHHGIPDALFLILGLPMLFAIFIGGPLFMLQLFGAPMPPFLVPKWIREQDRERRRLKRAARDRRWQDPEVKKSEKWENVLGIPITVGTVAVVLTLGVLTISANGGS